MLQVILSGRYMAQEKEPRNSMSVGTALYFVHAMKQTPICRTALKAPFQPETPCNLIKHVMSRTV